MNVGWESLVRDGNIKRDVTKMGFWFWYENKQDTDMCNVGMRNRWGERRGWLRGKGGEEYCWDVEGDRWCGLVWETKRCVADISRKGCG